MIQECVGKRIDLAETLDRVLNKGVMNTGDIVISVANIDLIYVQLSVLICSIETAMKRKHWHTENKEIMPHA